MADEEDGLLAIEVDADDYAETAAGDVPSVSRTYQSEEAFQVQKDTYRAKIDGANSYRDLIAAIPILGLNDLDRTSDPALSNGHSKVKLSKKDIQLLGYAVGELHYQKDYERTLELCERVNRLCEVDSKTNESLSRWTKRCRERIDLRSG